MFNVESITVDDRGKEKYLRTLLRLCKYRERKEIEVPIPRRKIFSKRVYSINIDTKKYARMRKLYMCAFNPIYLIRLITRAIITSTSIQKIKNTLADMCVNIDD